MKFSPKKSLSLMPGLGKVDQKDKPMKKDKGKFPFKMKVK